MASTTLSSTFRHLQVTRLRDLAETAGYASVEEFIQRVLEKELERVGDPDDEAAVIAAFELPENRGYWRDVGTIEAYYEANMDLRSVKPALNLYNYQWPLRTAEYPQGPSKFTFDEAGRRGHALNSVVSEGCILASSSWPVASHTCSSL